MSDVDKAVATAVEEQHEKQNNPTHKKKWRRLKEIDQFGEYKNSVNRVNRDIDQFGESANSVNRVNLDFNQFG